eukprot:SAG22_NODE_124_length_18884_cov_34.149367_1_plen_192_part_00
MAQEEEGPDLPLAQQRRVEVRVLRHMRCGGDRPGPVLGLARVTAPGWIHMNMYPPGFVSARRPWACVSLTQALDVHVGSTDLATWSDPENKRDTIKDLADKIFGGEQGRLASRTPASSTPNWFRMNLTHSGVIRIGRIGQHADTTRGIHMDSVKLICIQLNICESTLVLSLFSLFCIFPFRNLQSPQTCIL